jgi:hypothetical protein
MTKPTAKQLWNEELDEPIWHEDTTGWRHGYYTNQVYLRKEDNTYWMASYEVSTDGETNGLREGTAKIVQCMPFTKTITSYVPFK